jgi:hypothetical protein
MSTKIYSGYILDEGMNPFEMIPALQKKFKAPIQKKIYGFYFHHLFRLYDLMTYNDGEVAHLLDDIAAKHQDQYLPEKRNVPFVSLMARAEAEARVKMEAYDYQVEILFAQDPETKRYLTYFMGSREMEDKFRKMKGVSDYCYYNNTDEPEDVSEEDWQERGRAWDRTVNLDDPLVNSMLSLQVLSTVDRTCHLSIPEMMKLKPAFPDREQRVHLLANTLLLENYFKDNPELERNYQNIVKAQAENFKYNRLSLIVDKNLGEDITPELLHQKVKDSFKHQ